MAEKEHQFKSYEEAKAALQHQMDLWDSTEFTQDSINQAFGLARECLSLVSNETVASQKATVLRDLARDLATFDHKLEEARKDEDRTAILAKAKIGFKRAFETLIK